MARDFDSFCTLLGIKSGDIVKVRRMIMREPSLMNMIRLGIFRKPKIENDGIYHFATVYGFDKIKGGLQEKTVPEMISFKPESIPIKIYSRVAPINFDIPRSNSSIGFYGISGCGKSEVAFGFVEAQLKNGQKFHIISIKPHDKWLSLDGFRIITIKNGAPNPFLYDIEILIRSVMLATSSIASQGINANAMESIMRKICSPIPKNWSEILKRLEKMKKESDLSAGFESLILKIEEFASIPVIDDFEITKDNIVFNFEGIEKERLIFWSNMVMSVAYEKMKKSENKDLTLIIDEAHSIIPSDPDAAKHSIVNSVARMGRAFGSFFVISQMMSDIPYFIRENCGMIFAFGTNSALELGLVPDRLMDWTLQHLPLHAFIDLKANYGIFVPIFKFYEDDEKIRESQISENVGEIPSQEVAHASEPEVKIQKKTRPEEDDIVATLEKSEVSMYPRQLSNVQAEKLGLDKDKTSLYVSKLAYRMARENKICFDIVEDYYEGKEKEWKLFCPINSDLLHVWMVRRVVDEIRTRTSLEIQYVSEGTGRSGADISTDFNFEIETGKMNDDANLMSRITNSKKTVVIIVPDSKVKAEYLTKNYPRPVEILTLREFVKKLAAEQSK